MDQTDEMINVLAETVEELKRGILDYSNQMPKVSPEQQYQLQEKVKQMHQIALKLNSGIIGLQELKAFTARELGRQG